MYSDYKHALAFIYLSGYENLALYKCYRNDVEVEKLQF